jgi:hypothetical protein
MGADIFETYDNDNTYDRARIIIDIGWGYKDILLFWVYSAF